jgi:hypothetical protein
MTRSFSTIKSSTRTSKPIRDHLRVADHILRVLTMKEAVTETRPLALDAVLKIPAKFRVITEWTPIRRQDLL